MKTTSVELSQKLVEAGVKGESRFVWNKIYSWRLRERMLCGKLLKNSETTIPAYTLDELLDMVEGTKHLVVPSPKRKLPCMLMVWNEDVDLNVASYQDLPKTFTAPTPIEAVAEALIGRE